MPCICSEYKVHGCPASFYLACPAFSMGLNCWEVPEKPCCAVTDLSQCSDCEIFKRGIKAMNMQKSEPNSSAA